MLHCISTQVFCRFGYKRLTRIRKSMIMITDGQMVVIIIIIIIIIIVIIIVIISVTVTITFNDNGGTDR